MEAKKSKIIVRDGEGNLIQVYPEVKVDLTIDQSSSNPVSGSAVASYIANGFISKTGNESISGQKTFTEGPYQTASQLQGNSIDLSTGSVFTKTISSDTAFTISNAPAGKASQFILVLENGGAGNVTWPNSVTWAAGKAPVLPSTGKSVLRFVSPDGTNWLGCMDGSSAKEVGYFTIEPTASNSVELDNEAFIFQQVSTSPTSAFTAFVHASGNETITGTKTFIDPIAGSINGNAGTATSLATPRTISLTGEVLGSALFDGSADSAITAALGTTIAGDKMFSGSLAVGGNLAVAGNPTCGNDEIIHIPNTAAAHNAIYRGKDLTEVYTLTQLSEKLAAGDFSDLFIGDYISLPFSYASEELDISVYKNVNFRFAHFNYWMNKGYKETGNSYGELSANHIFLVPDEPLFDSYMNETNTAANGLHGSWLWNEMQVGLAEALNGESCLNGHILPHSNILSNAINEQTPSGGCTSWFGAPTAWKWYDENILFINEVMAFGTRLFSSSGYDIGAGNTQLALFHLDPSWINSKGARSTWWLGSIASGQAFCNVNGQGRSHNSYASKLLGVRPGMLFA